MLRLSHCIVLLLAASLVACKKESVNPGNATASFSLLTTGAVCGNATANGSYEVGTPLAASNEMVLEVTVTAIGSYKISSTTLSGIRFTDSGAFVRTGIQSLHLRGEGTPTVPGTHTFQFNAGSNSCLYSITIAQPVSTGPADNDHMLFGNPSNAASLEDSANNFLMRKSFYTLSYSRDGGTPNWVSWHLFGADIGSVPRQDDFRPDATLPAGWYQVPETAYSGSGFDRGHNIPSADRTSTYDANSSTFLMTNMIPQAPNLNQKAWAALEDSLRRYATGGYELYIVMGSYGTGGTGSSGFYNTVNGGKVTVPAFVWKIALIISNGNNDTTRVDASTRLIAVNMPNNNSVGTNWKNYRVSVDAIEAATGYDLLSRLPVASQGLLEAKVDNW